MSFLMTAPEKTPAKASSFSAALSHAAEIYKVAEIYAGSNLIPKAYVQNPNNCFIAISIAERMDLDPLTVMQNLYVVYGTPSWSGKFIAGLINGCGKFYALWYDETVDGTVRTRKGNEIQNKVCIAKAIEISTGREISGPPISIKSAIDNGWWDKPSDGGGGKSNWEKNTDLMLRYRAASYFGKTVCPEVLLGLSTKEEVEEQQGTFKRDTETAEDAFAKLAKFSKPKIEAEKYAIEEPVKIEEQPAEVSSLKLFETAIAEAENDQQLLAISANIKASESLTDADKKTLRKAFKKRSEDFQNPDLKRVPMTGAELKRCITTTLSAKRLDELDAEIVEARLGGAISEEEAEGLKALIAGRRQSAR